MKTPEELAEEYADGRCGKWDECERDNEWEEAKRGFAAGYKTAKEHAHAALEEAEARIAELEDQVADVSKVMPDSCKHILHMEKMVDVSTSATLNNWISVKDRLPEINNRMSDDVLILDSYGYMGVEPFEKCGDEIGVDWGEAGLRPLSDFTHWMPLPAAPKEEK